MLMVRLCAAAGLACSTAVAHAGMAPVFAPGEAVQTAPTLPLNHMAAPRPAPGTAGAYLAQWHAVYFRIADERARADEQLFESVSRRNIVSRCDWEAARPLIATSLAARAAIRRHVDVLSSEAASPRMRDPNRPDAADYSRVLADTASSVLRHLDSDSRRVDAIVLAFARCGGAAAANGGA